MPGSNEIVYRLANSEENNDLYVICDLRFYMSRFTVTLDCFDFNHS